MGPFLKVYRHPLVSAAKRHPITPVVLIALAFRIGWHLYGPVTQPPDAAVYLQSGRDLLATGQMSSTYYMPLYPALLAALGTKAMTWLQIFLSSLTPVLVYLLSRRIWGHVGVSKVAALLCAIHPVLTYYANLYLTETLFTFLLLAGLVLLYSARFASGSVALVLADLIKPSLDFVIPVVVLAIAFGARPRRPIRAILTYTVIYVALMSPWWWHNYNKYEAFVRLTLAGGVTAILENNPKYTAREGNWLESVDWGRYEAIKDPIKRDAAMKDDAVRFVAENPLLWIGNSIRRLGRFFTPWPTPSGLVVKIACAAFLIPIFLFALWATIKQRRLATIPLLILVVFLTALHSATHANIRYRLPLDPLFIVLAVGAIKRVASDDQKESIAGN